jgi:hypothetical protein
MLRATWVWTKICDVRPFVAVIRIGAQGIAFDRIDLDAWADQHAQEQLAKRIDGLRSARLYGVRPEHAFRAAAMKFLKENQHKRSIADDAMQSAATSDGRGEEHRSRTNGR